MKTLKIVFIVSLILCIFVPFSNAQEEKVYPLQLSLGAMFHSANEEVFDDIYGSGFILKGAIHSFANENFRAGVEIGIMSQDGDPYTSGYVTSSSASLTHLELNLIGHYVIRSENANGILPYVGGGLSFIKITEEVEVNSESVKESFDATGIILLVGADIPVDETKTLYLEFSYNTAEIDGVWGDTDVGGKNIGVGIRFHSSK